MVYSYINDTGVSGAIKPVSMALDLINRFMFVSAYGSNTNLYYIYRLSMNNTGTAVTLENPNNYYDDRFIAAKAGATGSIAVYRKHWFAYLLKTHSVCKLEILSMIGLQ